MDITLIRSVYRNEPREKFIRTWNNPYLSTRFISCLGDIYVVLVLDMNPGILLQIKANSTQVRILRMSKVDKGLANKNELD